MKQEIPAPEAAGVKPLQRGDSALVRYLQQQEYEVYLWLLNAYSIGWIAETMGLVKRTIKTLAKNIYTILKVNDQRELIRYYFVPINESPILHGEELANSMAYYTDQCVQTYSLRVK
jgi:DNA-binding CsgD family transcriptional regulator